jgi:hypothetical protein
VALRLLSGRMGGGLILGFIPEFLAKTQVANTYSRPVSIPSLSRSVMCDLPDRTLCPVHALKSYLFSKLTLWGNFFRTTM